MKRFYAQPETVYNAFKERADNTVKDHLDCIDEDIRRVVAELNQLDGVAPVWSCASHPETRRVADRKLHVICAVNDTGAEMLDKVYQEWTRILIDYMAFHLPNLGIVRLELPLSDGSSEPVENRLYYAVELKVERVPTKKFKRGMLISLEEAIRNVSF